MTEETLEAKSLWYKYKSRVWNQKSEQTAVVHNIMRVLRSVRNSGQLAYVSVPITSGQYLYRLQLQYPSTDMAELITWAIEYNYQYGWDFVRNLAKRRDCPILYPADLTPVHQEWEQDHFQALWLSIIAEKCTELHMSKNWEFSNGAAEEFTHAMQLRLGLPKDQFLAFYNTKEDEKRERERMRSIKIYDHRGKLISLDRGYRAIEKSITWMREHGFGTIKTMKLQNCLSLLDWTGNMLAKRFYQ
jgi:hypothetical protein